VLLVKASPHLSTEHRAESVVVPIAPVSGPVQQQLIDITCTEWIQRNDKRWHVTNRTKMSMLIIVHWV
jgi:hypothetical protein